ncbi:MAG: sigma-70 family RNA polymerase sigma factor [Pseudomonadota bacterium]
MTETNLTMLRRLLVERYDEFRTRLAKRLGSTDLAGDAMQDTWLKLARVEAIGPIHSPSHYLFSIALNAARDRLQTDARYLSPVEVESLLDLVDAAPDPARVAEARSDLSVIEMALAELPPRRRDILLAARLDNLPRQEIAKRLGISLRLVEKELHLAQAYCLARLTEATK